MGSLEHWVLEVHGTPRSVPVLPSSASGAVPESSDCGGAPVSSDVGPESVGGGGGVDESGVPVVFPASAGGNGCCVDAPSHDPIDSTGDGELPFTRHTVSVAPVQLHASCGKHAVPSRLGRQAPGAPQLW
jgi:hypothetical protein